MDNPTGTEEDISMHVASLVAYKEATCRQLEQIQAFISSLDFGLKSCFQQEKSERSDATQQDRTMLLNHDFANRLVMKNNNAEQ
jgi:hypothetical protein